MVDLGDRELLIEFGAWLESQSRSAQQIGNQDDYQLWVDRFLSERPAAAGTGVIRTYSGRWLSYIDPQPEDIFFVDIAMGVCRESRFAGQVALHHVVGDHSIRVWRGVQRELATGVLFEPPVDTWQAEAYSFLHDGSEGYARDLPSPLKELCRGYRVVEKRLMAAILDAFDIRVDDNILALTKEADMRMLLTEMRDLRLDGYIDPPLLEAGWRPYDEKIVPLSPNAAFLEFVSIGYELGLVKGRHSHLLPAR